MVEQPAAMYVPQTKSREKPVDSMSLNVGKAKRDRQTTSSVAEAGGGSGIEAIVVHVDWPFRGNIGTDAECEEALRKIGSRYRLRGFCEDRHALRESLIVSTDEGGQIPMHLRTGHFARFIFVLPIGHAEIMFKRLIASVSHGSGNDELLNEVGFSSEGAVNMMNSGGKWHLLHEFQSISSSVAHTRACTLEWLQSTDWKDPSDVESCVAFIRSSDGDSTYASHSCLNVTTAIPAVNLLRKALRHHRWDLLIPAIRTLLPLCFMRDSHNYGPVLLEYLCTFLVRAPTVIREWHEKTFAMLGDAIDLRQEEMNARIKQRVRDLSSTTQYETASLLVNTSSHVRPIVHTQQDIPEHVEEMRTETKLDVDTRKVFAKLMEWRTYQKIANRTYCSTYDGSARMITGVDVLFHTAPPIMTTYVSAYMRQADNPTEASHVTWTPKVFITSEEVDRHAQTARKRAEAASKK